MFFFLFVEVLLWLYVLIFWFGWIELLWKNCLIFMVSEVFDSESLIVYFDSDVIV